MQYSVVIPCAGIGSRMNLGYNKMLYKFSNGETVLEKTLNVFMKDEQCTQIILVCNNDDLCDINKLTASHKIVYTIGGETRQDSVRNGLELVTCDYVLIHDGARPYLSQQSINNLLKELKDCSACLLMVAVKDTIKEVKNGVVVKTLARGSLMQAQTPQAFHTGLIKEAHHLALMNRYNGTDDSELVEKFTDTRVVVVKGDYNNIKITTIEDIKR